MATSTIKNPMSQIVNNGNQNIFFVFANVQDGSFYYSDSMFVPTGKTLTLSSSSSQYLADNNITINRYGCYYRLATGNSDFKGKSINLIGTFT